jgi:hypothetical protein
MERDIVVEAVGRMLAVRGHVVSFYSNEELRTRELKIRAVICQAAARLLMDELGVSVELANEIAAGRRSIPEG